MAIMTSKPPETKNVTGRVLYTTVRGGDLVVGRPVPYSIYDTYDRLLLRRGRTLKNETQRQVLLELGRIRAASPETIHDYSEPHRSHVPPPQQDGTFDPFELFERCAHSLRQIHRGVELGRNNFLPRLERLIGHLGNLIDRDPEAALGAAHIDRTFPVSIVHPIRQAIVSDLLARAAGLPGERRRAAVGASLTANLGMLNLQEELDQQQSSLTDQQRRLIQQHPAHSADILEQAGLTDSNWLRAVREHHERMDGSGYPNGLTGDVIARESAIVMLADVYMAMATPRAHRPAHIVRNALRELFEEAGSQFDNTLTNLLIREVGVYPPGTMVRLTNGETALATRRGKRSTEPQVFLLRRADGGPFLHPRFRKLHEEGEPSVDGVLRQEDVPVLYSPHIAWGYESDRA
ncbi:HD-GYP domain-containing protein [Halorhodospira halophila]|uniref:HD-GYP domain-containing protein n=1 Tax=Halorhodospira halophila TaxID=1053 RepID=UPI001911CCE9|nr:HD domain-containing phosphohydrolase [Halorhodospira halophila]